MSLTTAPGRPLIQKATNMLSKPFHSPLIPTTLPLLHLSNPELERLRIVPSLMAFYAGNPVHDQNISDLRAMVQRHINLPTKTILNAVLRSQRFILIESYRAQIQLGSRLKSVHYKELVALLHRLRSIDPELMPRDVSHALSKYYAVSQNSSSNTTINVPIKSLDKLGRAFGKAKRKQARSQVHLVRGQGEILCNGLLLTLYFTQDQQRRRLAFPFQVIGQEGLYNIFITVHGGGKSGQAEAAMYAISKALVVFNPLVKPRLYKAGLMTSDARVVERKKPGKLKARKSPAWVKR